MFDGTEQERKGEVEENKGKVAEIQQLCELTMAYKYWIKLPSSKNKWNSLPHPTPKCQATL
jgi:hypothetical protein